MTKSPIENEFEIIQNANKEGYAGILPSGMLVDRRKTPEANPVSENPMFNITEPRCIKCGEVTPIFELKVSLCKKCRKK